ncbi:hypothetical protein H0H93_011301 [Arthromyces matolae]|nr:hypothetical protein H0H93_011301 [Arthromyces matolae]
MLGVFFQPTTQLNLTNGGEITWGGVDESKFLGDIVFTNITTTYPSSRFWGLDLEATYGANLTILSGSSGLVDTGSPFLSLRPDAYNEYIEAIGAVFDPVVGMPKVNATQAALLQPLYFHINGVPFEMSPNAQSWPRSLNSALYGTSTATQDLDSTFLVIVEGGTTYDFILGYTFLERFYVAFDAENNRVGFAPTHFTKAIIN